MNMYSSGELNKIFEGVFVTPALLAEYNMKEVKMSLDIKRVDYAQCRQELLSLTQSKGEPDVRLSATECSDYATEEEEGVDNVQTGTTL